MIRATAQPLADRVDSEGRSAMKRIAWCAFFALVSVAGAAMASTSPPSNAPAAYMPQTPVIQGRVVSVSDVGMVVDTDQGQRVQLAMDSRTLLPTDLDKGMEMKAEFKVLDNGAFYAKRVIPIRTDQDQARRVAYAKTNEETMLADNEAAEHGPEVEGEPASASSHETHENTLRSDSEATTTNSSDNDHMSTSETERPSDETLPDTASHEPLAAMLGLILVGAGLIAWSRRPSRA
jgi:hypothetical protein